MDINIKNKCIYSKDINQFGTNCRGKKRMEVETVSDGERGSEKIQGK